MVNEWRRDGTGTVQEWRRNNKGTVKNLSGVVKGW